MRAIYVGDDWQYLHYVDSRDATQPGNVRIPATGLAPTAYLSLGPAPGTPIAGTQVTLAEQPATSGWYTATVDKAAVAAAVGGLLGAVVYEIVEVTGDHVRVTPLVVRQAQILS